ncbi:tol-pal system protein YbgF [Maricaulis parjimensis]|uniref:tol-pal system protein YbgF n=1 Tax=Maricaulis parjimensis TaxID=144023 RepID=UPI00193931EE|nr:tol-pal system protein YbgF [Maricaulis parjimensis]
MMKYLSLPVLLAALVITSPAQSQSRRELAERIDATEVRIGELEDQFMAGDPVAETLMRRLDEMEYQLRELTSETERLAFENRQLRQQISEMEAQQAAAVEEPPMMDDEAMAWMQEGLDPETGESVAIVDPNDPHAEARAAATGVLGAPSGNGGGMPLPAAEARDPAELFAEAHGQLLDGNFDGAQSGFETFVNENPDHELSGQAWYWLGETFFVRSDFAAAADAYIAALRAQPSGEKAPDSLVRLAASLNGMGRQADACATLGRFSGQFPNASAASRARARREAVRAGCE